MDAGRIIVTTRDKYSIFLLITVPNTEPTWSNINDPEFWSDYITDMVQIYLHVELFKLA